MTTRWPSSCSRAASSISTFSNKGSLTQQLLLRRPNNGFYITSHARYISSTPKLLNAKTAQTTKPAPEKAALLAIESGQNVHPINPPSSTLPPPLQLPERGDLGLPMYYFKIGRAYGSFYWLGIKAVWFNHQASKALKTRLASLTTTSDGQQKPHSEPDRLRLMARSEFQLLARNAHDIGKLPFFGLLVCLFGEWLPLIVPFIPWAVPGTCRIPKQIRGMRAQAEERRRIAFRNGTAEPGKEELHAKNEDTPDGLGRTEWPTTQRGYCSWMLGKLKDEQLLHLSSVLNLHGSLWDRIQLPPPSFLLRRGIARRLADVSGDDYLLVRYGDGKAVKELLPDEVASACEQRGIDVLGKREETLRKELGAWLKRRKGEGGEGGGLLVMLFRRPNAWDTKVDR